MLILAVTLLVDSPQQSHALPRTSILARSHPLKPLPPLPSNLPHLSRGTSTRPSTTGGILQSEKSTLPRVPTWFFPTDEDSHYTMDSLSSLSTSPHTSPFPGQPIRRPSTASTMYTRSVSTFEDPPSPSPAASPFSSPGGTKRPSPIRQRTFGFVESHASSCAFPPIDEIDHHQAWSIDVDGNPVVSLYDNGDNDLIAVGRGVGVAV